MLAISNLIWQMAGKNNFNEFSFECWLKENKLDPELCQILKDNGITNETSILGLTEKDLDQLFEGLPKRFGFRSSLRFAQRSLDSNVFSRSSKNDSPRKNRPLEAGAYRPMDKSPRDNKAFIDEDNKHVDLKNCTVGHAAGYSQQTNPAVERLKQLFDDFRKGDSSSKSTIPKNLTDDKDMEESDDTYDTKKLHTKQEHGFRRNFSFGRSVRNSAKTSQSLSVAERAENVQVPFQRNRLYATFGGRSSKSENRKSPTQLPIFVYSRSSPSEPAALGLNPRLVKENSVREIYRNLFRTSDRQRYIHLFDNTLLITEPISGGKFVVIDYSTSEDVEMVSIHSAYQLVHLFPGYVLSEYEHMVMVCLKKKYTNSRKKSNNYYIKFAYETDKLFWLDIFKPQKNEEEEESF